MTQRQPNLCTGEHELQIIKWELKDSDKLQLTIKAIQEGFRPVWRTFSTTKAAINFLYELTGKQLTQLETTFLDELRGRKFKGLIKQGHGHFMNLTRVTQGLQPPIFNNPNPVNDCQLAVIFEPERGGQDVRQTSPNLP